MTQPAFFIKVSKAVDPASIPAGQAANTNVSIAQAKAGDHVLAVPPVDLEAGLVPQGARCDADGTVILRLYNPTGGAVDGASKTWGFTLIRGEASALEWAG